MKILQVNAKIKTQNAKLEFKSKIQRALTVFIFEFCFLNFDFIMTRGATQKIVLSAIVVITAVGLLYFISRTFEAYFSGPSITITSPYNYEAFSTSTTTISGNTERIKEITLDGRPITIDDKGNFSEVILLIPGYNIETITAHDQFGHVTQKQLQLVYLAPKITASTSMATSTTATSTISTTTL